MGGAQRGYLWASGKTPFAGSFACLFLGEVPYLAYTHSTAPCVFHLRNVACLAGIPEPGSVGLGEGAVGGESPLQSSLTL